MQRISHNEIPSNLMDASSEADKNIQHFVRSPMRDLSASHERKLSKSSNYAVSKKKLSEIHCDLVQLESKFEHFQNNLKHINIEGEKRCNSSNINRSPKIKIIENNHNKEGSDSKKIIINNKTYTCRNFPASYFENVGALFEDKNRRQKKNNQNSQKKVSPKNPLNANKRKGKENEKDKNNIQSASSQAGKQMPYARPTGLFRKNSNFTVKTIQTKRNQNEKSQPKPMNINKINKQEKKNQRQKENRFQERNHEEFHKPLKERFMFLTPKESQTVSRHDGSTFTYDNKDHVGELSGGISRQKQLQGCIRMMKNEHRINAYCDCCSHNDSNSPSPHKNVSSYSLSVQKSRSKFSKTAEHAYRQNSKRQKERKNTIQQEEEEMPDSELNDTIQRQSMYESNTLNPSILENFSMQTRKKVYRKENQWVKGHENNKVPRESKNEEEFWGKGIFYRSELKDQKENKNITYYYGHQDDNLKSKTNRDHYQEDNFQKSFGNNSAVGRTRKIMNRTEISQSKMQRSSTANPVNHSRHEEKKIPIIEVIASETQSLKKNVSAEQKEINNLFKSFEPNQRNQKDDEQNNGTMLMFTSHDHFCFDESSKYLTPKLSERNNALQVNLNNVPKPDKKQEAQITCKNQEEQKEEKLKEEEELKQGEEEVDKGGKEGKGGKVRQNQQENAEKQEKICPEIMEKKDSGKEKSQKQAKQKDGNGSSKKIVLAYSKKDISNKSLSTTRDPNLRNSSKEKGSSKKLISVSKSMKKELFNSEKNEENSKKMGVNKVINLPLNLTNPRKITAGASMSISIPGCARRNRNSANQQIKMSSNNEIKKQKVSTKTLHSSSKINEFKRVEQTQQKIVDRPQIVNVEDKGKHEQKVKEMLENMIQKSEEVEGIKNQKQKDNSSNWKQEQDEDEENQQTLEVQNSDKSEQKAKEEERKIISQQPLEKTSLQRIEQKPILILDKSEVLIEKLQFKEQNQQKLESQKSGSDDGLKEVQVEQSKLGQGQGKEEREQKNKPFFIHENTFRERNNQGILTLESIISQGSKCHNLQEEHPQQKPSITNRQSLFGESVKSEEESELFGFSKQKINETEIKNETTEIRKEENNLDEEEVQLSENKEISQKEKYQELNEKKGQEKQILLRASIEEIEIIEKQEQYFLQQQEPQQLLKEEQLSKKEYSSEKEQLSEKEESQSEKQSKEEEQSQYREKQQYPSQDDKSANQWKQEEREENKDPEEKEEQGERNCQDVKEQSSKEQKIVVLESETLQHFEEKAQEEEEEEQMKHQRKQEQVQGKGQNLEESHQEQSEKQESQNSEFKSNQDNQENQEKEKSQNEQMNSSEYFQSSMTLGATMIRQQIEEQTVRQRRLSNILEEPIGSISKSDGGESREENESASEVQKPEEQSESIDDDPLADAGLSQKIVFIIENQMGLAKKAEQLKLTNEENKTKLARKTSLQQTIEVKEDKEKKNSNFKKEHDNERRESKEKVKKNLVAAKPITLTQHNKKKNNLEVQGKQKQKRKSCILDDDYVPPEMRKSQEEVEGNSLYEKNLISYTDSEVMVGGSKNQINEGGEEEIISGSQVCKIDELEEENEIFQTINEQKNNQHPESEKQEQVLQKQQREEAEENEEEKGIQQEQAKNESKEFERDIPLQQFNKQSSFMIVINSEKNRKLSLVKKQDDRILEQIDEKPIGNETKNANEIMKRSSNFDEKEVRKSKQESVNEEEHQQQINGEKENHVLIQNQKIDSVSTGKQNKKCTIGIQCAYILPIFQEHFGQSEKLVQIRSEESNQIQKPSVMTKMSRITENEKKLMLCSRQISVKQYSSTESHSFHRAFGMTINSHLPSTIAIPVPDSQQNDKILSKQSFFTYTYAPEQNKDQTIISIEPEFSNLKQKKVAVAEITKFIQFQHQKQNQILGFLGSSFSNAHNTQQKVKKIHIKSKQISQKLKDKYQIAKQALESIVDSDKKVFVNRLFAGKSNRTCWLFYNGKFQEMGTATTINSERDHIVQVIINELNCEKTCKNILQMLTGAPILPLKPKNWNKLCRINQHPNIYGIAINSEKGQIHTITGAQEVTSKSSEERIKIVSMQNEKGTNFNIKWTDFFNEYHEPLIACLNPQYYLRYQTVSPPPDTHQCYIVEMMIYKLEKDKESKKQEKAHCVMGFQSQHNCYGNLAVYAEVNANKYEYVGCGEMNFVSMRVATRKYLIVLEKCRAGLFLMTCSMDLQLKQGKWAANLESALNCQGQQLLKCSR